MAQLQESFVGRWPVAVLAVAGVAAVSLGDLVAGWYAATGRRPSAAAEYPVRIALRQAGPAASGSLASADKAGMGREQAIDLLQQPAADPLSPAARPSRGPATDGAPAVQFDLAGPAETRGQGSAVEVRKVVRLNGADAGDARIHVDANSTISIEREELGRLLARSGRQELTRQLGSGSRLVSFDELRSQGIEVRYDPASDRILVST